MLISPITPEQPNSSPRNCHNHGYVQTVTIYDSFFPLRVGVLSEGTPLRKYFTAVRGTIVSAVHSYPWGAFLSDNNHHGSFVYFEQHISAFLIICKLSFAAGKKDLNRR